VKEQDSTKGEASKAPFVVSLDFDDSFPGNETRLQQQHLVPNFLPPIAWTQKVTHEGS
jgi:hypothetical protein